MVKVLFNIRLGWTQVCMYIHKKDLIKTFKVLSIEKSFFSYRVLLFVACIQGIINCKSPANVVYCAFIFN